MFLIQKITKRRKNTWYELTGVLSDLKRAKFTGSAPVCLSGKLWLEGIYCSALESTRTNKYLILDVDIIQNVTYLVGEK